EVAVRTAGRGDRALDLPEGGRGMGKVVVGGGEAGVIQHVVSIGTHAEGQPTLGDPEVLLDGHVHVEVSRPPELVSRNVPKCVLTRLSEPGRIETLNIYFAVRDRAHEEVRHDLSGGIVPDQLAGEICVNHTVWLASSL